MTLREGSLQVKPCRVKGPTCIDSVLWLTPHLMNLDIVPIERKPEDSGAYFRADSIDPLPKYRSTVLPQ